MAENSSTGYHLPSSKVRPKYVNSSAFLVTNVSVLVSTLMAPDLKG